MLRQGQTPREFPDATAMRAHYAAVRARLWEKPLADQAARVNAAEEAAAAGARAALAAAVDRMAAEAGPTRDPQVILARTARAFGVEPADLTGPNRTAAVCGARFAAIDAVHRARPDLSNKRIGRIFGGRDHSTIFAALARNARLGVPLPPAPPEAP